MSKIFSQDEIDRLLCGDSDPTLTSFLEDGSENFKQPKGNPWSVPMEKLIPVEQMMDDLFNPDILSYFADKYRKTIDTYLVSIDQLFHYEFVTTTPTPAFIRRFDTEQFSGIFEANPHIINLLYAGDKDNLEDVCFVSKEKNKLFTEFSDKILERLEDILGIQFKKGKITNEFIGIMNYGRIRPQTRVLMPTFDMLVDGTKYNLNIEFPTKNFMSYIEKR